METTQIIIGTGMVGAEAAGGTKTIEASRAANQATAAVETTTAAASVARFKRYM